MIKDKEALFGLIFGLIVGALLLPFVRLRPSYATEQVVTDAGTQIQFETETEEIDTDIIVIEKAPCIVEENYEFQMAAASNETVESVESIETDGSEAENTYETIETEFVPLNVPLDYNLQAHIKHVSDEFNVPYELILAICYAESNFDFYAHSPTDDYGLMQINKCCHADMIAKYGITDFYDPYQNVLCGIDIFSEHYFRCGGNITLALMCYHDGQGGAELLWEQGIYSTEYTQKVLSKYYEYIGG